MATDSHALHAVDAVAAADTEARLVQRAAGRDDHAYAALIRRHEHVAYRVAAAVTGSVEDGEEAVQNAYVKAYRSLRSFRRGSPFRPWLLRIVVNEAHNVRRAERRHRRLAERALGEPRPAAVRTTDEVLSERHDTEVMLEALARLPETDRLALALRYFGSLADREAAALVGVTTGAYRVRVLRALRRLRDLLSDDDG